MAVLSSDQIAALHHAVLDADLADSRAVLLKGIDRRFVAALPAHPSPSAQILGDLRALNEAPGLVDGSTPIRTWLENAVLLAGPRPEAALFRTLLSAAQEIAPAPAAPRPKAPRHMLFPQSSSFVGREDELTRIHDLLQKGGAVGVRPAALTGMGGIGKTQLAVAYAYRFADAYPGGVYWVNAAEDWQAEAARLAIEIGLDTASGSESERQIRLARAFADHLRARPDALVIFDNVEDPLALRSAAPGFIPAELGCRLLFTTRRRDPDAPFETVDVRVLPEDIALRLLLESGPRGALLEGGPAAEIDVAKAICASLGCLPLALVLAAAFLARYPRISLADYLTRIRNEGALAAADAAKVDPRALGTRHDAAVGATLRTQWDAIASGEAKRALMVTALLGEAALVPRARLGLLSGLADEAEPGYPAPLEEALAELGALSLVEELGDHAIRLHPLVREFAEKQINAREAFAAACASRLGDALHDMGRLHREVAQRGIDAVLEDLRAGEQLAGPKGRERIETLIRPLDQESHALRRWDAAKDPGFFLQQFRNRCFQLGLAEVREQAEAKLEEQRWPWLRERIRTSRESDALVRTLEGHTHWVNDVAVMADGRFAVSASWDQTLKVWDLRTGQVMHTLEGHNAPVYGVAVTADDRFAISASMDTTLKVWDLHTGLMVRTLEGHAGEVNDVAVTADGHFAISAAMDRTLKVWGLRTGQMIYTLEGHAGEVNGVAVTADDRFAISASADSTLKVWDLRTGQVVRTLRGHAGEVNGVAVTADDRFAISASADSTLKVWDLHTGQVMHTLEGHNAPVYGMAVTTDDRFAISASVDTTLKVWNLHTGR